MADALKLDLPKAEIKKESKNALLNTVPTYAVPKEYTVDLKSAAEAKSVKVDTSDMSRDSLLARLYNALDAAPDDVTAMLEARLANLVHEAEHLVPGLVD